jgi:hypothetical protein
MNFLIVYDLAAGRSTITEYPDAAVAEAQRSRLDAELSALASGEHREIVVLNAKSIADLRETHARYFGDDVLRAEVSRLLGVPPAA